MLCGRDCSNFKVNSALERDGVEFTLEIEELLNYTAKFIFGIFICIILIYHKISTFLLFVLMS